MNGTQLQTILWLRWRLMCNQWRRGAGALGAVFTILVSVLALVVGVLSFAGGVAGGAFGLVDVSPRKVMVAWLVITLLFLFVWMIGLLTELQRSEAIDLQKLMHLPVALGQMFAINYLASHFSLSLVFVVPLMTGLGLGMAFRHGPAMLLLIPLAWNMRRHLKPYQQQRIETFLHPEEDQRGAGYQILQSEIAVGSGGFWGKGFGKGSQNQLGFVPVRYSDFILAAMAEEQGFIGVCVVLLLYLGLILRLVDNAQKAKDRAGMYVVMGVTAILAFHVLVNASMVIGYMPVTGIPLPLMSYGGSATAFVFLALGLVMNVRMRRFVN